MLTALRRRGRRVHTNPDAGITLTELVVAMSLSSIIGVLAVTTFVTMSSAATRTTTQDADVASARNAIQDWTSLLQLADSPTSPGTTADRITSITSTEIVFYADIGNRATGARSCPTQVDLALTGGQLVEKRTSPDTTSGTCSYTGQPSSRYLAKDVTASGWVFTPFVNGDPPTATYATGVSGVLADVVRVDISFDVKASGESSARTLTSSAALTWSGT